MFDSACLVMAQILFSLIRLRLDVQNTCYPQPHMFDNISFWYYAVARRNGIFNVRCKVRFTITTS